MKTYKSAIFAFLFILILPIWTQAECPNQPESSIVDDQFKNLFKLKKELTKLQCNEPEKLATLLDTDKNGHHFLRNRSARNVPAEFIHDEAHCKKVEICTDFDEVRRNESFAKTMFNKKMLEATFQKALWEERKNNPKNCGMEKLEPSCTEALKVIYEVDNEEGALQKVKKNFIFKSNHFKESVSDNPAKDCPEFKINSVCKSYTEKIKSFSDCEDNPDNPGKDCYHEVQGALFNLIRDNYDDQLLYWALEKELCRPTRIFTPIPDEARFALENPNFVGPVRSPKDDTGLELIPGGSYAVNESSELTSFRKVENNANAGLGLNSRYSISNKFESKSGDADSAAAFESAKSDSVLNNFNNGLKQAYESQNGLNKLQNTDPSSNLNANSNFANFVNQLDNTKKDPLKDDSKKTEENESNKKDQINSLTAQIDSLNKKLSEMSSKLEDLKTNPESQKDSTELEQKKSNLEKEKAILELRNKIAELENQKKELVSKQTAQSEAKAAQSFSDQTKSFTSYSSPMASVNDYEDKSSGSQAGTNQQSYSAPPTQGSSGDYGRSPASNSTSAQNYQQGGIVLRTSGNQTSSTDNSTVYLTQDEVKNYPYRLETNATDLDIEKMFKESNGAPVLLGDSEQVVALKENGKLVYKRGKIIIVKNEKIKKESISRAISSVADLKKEEDKKSRDFIRYQEMKKGLKLNK